ncbi:MAG: hypothetical protein R3A45_03800 [Bdellovibrionota bacterium]
MLASEFLLSPGDVGYNLNFVYADAIEEKDRKLFPTPYVYISIDEYKKEKEKNNRFDPEIYISDMYENEDFRSQIPFDIQEDIKAFEKKFGFALPLYFLFSASENVDVEKRHAFIRILEQF